MEDFRRGMHLVIFALILLTFRRFLFHMVEAFDFTWNRLLDLDVLLEILWSCFLVSGIFMAFRVLRKEQPTQWLLIVVGLLTGWAIITSLVNGPLDMQTAFIVYWLFKALASLCFGSGTWLLWKSRASQDANAESKLLS
jgi:hypothetical protein